MRVKQQEQQKIKNFGGAPQGAYDFLFRLRKRKQFLRQQEERRGPLLVLHHRRRPQVRALLAALQAITLSALLAAL